MTRIRLVFRRSLRHCRGSVSHILSVRFEDTSDMSVVKKIHLVLWRLWFSVSDWFVWLCNLNNTEKAHVRNALKLMKDTEAKTSCHVVLDGCSVRFVLFPLFSFLHLFLSSSLSFIWLPYLSFFILLFHLPIPHLILVCVLRQNSQCISLASTCHLCVPACLLSTGIRNEYDHHSPFSLLESEISQVQGRYYVHI